MLTLADATAPTHASVSHLWAPMEGSGESDLPLPPGVWAHLYPYPQRCTCICTCICLLHARAQRAPSKKLRTIARAARLEQKMNALRAQRALSKNGQRRCRGPAGGHGRLYPYPQGPSPDLPLPLGVWERLIGGWFPPCQEGGFLPVSKSMYRSMYFNVSC